MLLNSCFQNMTTLPNDHRHLPRPATDRYRIIIDGALNRLPEDTECINPNRAQLTTYHALSRLLRAARKQNPDCREATLRVFRKHGAVFLGPRVHPKSDPRTCLQPPDAEDVAAFLTLLRKRQINGPIAFPLAFREQALAEDAKWPGCLLVGKTDCTGHFLVF